MNRFEIKIFEVLLLIPLCLPEYVNLNPTSTVELQTTEISKAYDCVYYLKRNVKDNQKNLRKIETGDQSLKTDSLFSCCDYCIGNSHYCNVFVFDQSQQICLMYVLAEEGEGSLRKYIQYESGFVAGSVVSYINSKK